MSRIPNRIKPVKGFSHSLHFGLNVILPFSAYLLVKIDFVFLAIALVLLSKWRIFAVQPRYWMANLVASGVDIIVGISSVLLIASTNSGWWQLFWVLIFTIWLVYLKPRSDVLSISAQAMIGQLLGLVVLYLKFGDSSLPVLVLVTWLITYFSARHFLSSFEEPDTQLLAHVWGYFAASLAFILGHWLVYYGSVAQIIVILTIVGYSLAALYYLDARGKLTTAIERQLLGITGAILVIVLIFSDWSGVTI